jgi:hypothetical protein
VNKLQHFQPELIIEIFPRCFQEEPARVNRGHCMKWAYLAYRIFRNCRLMSYGSHAFVRVGTLYFDSERLIGERDWRDLPACNFGKGCANVYCTSCLKAECVHPNEFKKRWQHCNGYQRWYEYRELANNFLQRKDNELAYQKTG